MRRNCTVLRRCFILMLILLSLTDADEKFQVFLLPWENSWFRCFIPLGYGFYWKFMRAIKNVSALTSIFHLIIKFPFFVKFISLETAKGLWVESQ